MSSSLFKSPTDSDFRELILIRHGATDMSGTLCGHSDPPLNDIGREQVKALARVSQGWGIERVYASHLQRASQTAQPIAAAYGLPISIRSDLQEMYFGRWEGKKWSEIRKTEPNLTSIGSSLELCAHGGETPACFRERVVRALREIATECNGQKVAIVSHLGVIRTILHELDSARSGVELPSRIDHCSVYHLICSR